MAYHEKSPQAARAISKMLAAGFARKDFRVRTQVKRARDPKAPGGYHREYGAARITIWDSKKALPLVVAMIENGLNVTVIEDPNPDAGHPTVMVDDYHPFLLNDEETQRRTGETWTQDPCKLVLVVLGETRERTRRYKITDRKTIKEAMENIVRRYADQDDR